MVGHWAPWPVKMPRMPGLSFASISRGRVPMLPGLAFSCVFTKASMACRRASRENALKEVRTLWVLRRVCNRPPRSPRFSDGSCLMCCKRARTFRSRDSPDAAERISGPIS
jgi:hypothetical protein